MNKYEILKEKLEADGTAQMRVFGNSMSGMIESGSYLTYEKKETHEYRVGDVVFCKVKGRYIDAHKITNIRLKKNGKQAYMIANNHGYQNGWTTSIYAKVVKIEAPEDLKKDQ